MAAPLLAVKVDNALNEMVPDISMASNSDLDVDEQPDCGACAEVVFEQSPDLVEIEISREGKRKSKRRYCRTHTRAMGLLGVQKIQVQ